MKSTSLKTCLLTITAFLMMSVAAHAQGFDQVAAAMQSGNASALAANFQGNVEIAIKNGEQSYSKSQAEMVLKNFFSSHSPRSFAIVHQGTSPEGSKFSIGTLVTSAGTYRVYVYAKSTGGTFSIQEIRFEEQ